jgi:hypothetical protein
MNTQIATGACLAVGVLAGGGVAGVHHDGVEADGLGKEAGAGLNGLDAARDLLAVLGGQRVAVDEGRGHRRMIRL